jgi:hypothetical protein
MIRHNSYHALGFGLRVAVAVVILVLGGSVRGEDFDPFQAVEWPSTPLRTTSPADPAVDPFEQTPAGNVSAAVATNPIAPSSSAINKLPPTNEYSVRSTSYSYQPTTAPAILPTPPQLPSTVPSSLAAGCGTPNEKPLSQLSIGVQLPQGEVPSDRAAVCWQDLNASTGGLGAARYWARQSYVWDATCFAHRPLYFEEINLERYGYGCHDCLQPFASAAHFFATVPALPYCMAADCPGECQYTLGHYRPGSCPPWRCHRPPISTRGGISEAGVLTGLIFLIP